MGVFLGKAATKELAFLDWGQGLEPAATKCEPSVIRGKKSRGWS